MHYTSVLLQWLVIPFADTFTDDMSLKTKKVGAFWARIAGREDDMLANLFVQVADTVEAMEGNSFLNVRALPSQSQACNARHIHRQPSGFKRQLRRCHPVSGRCAVYSNRTVAVCFHSCVCSSFYTWSVCVSPERLTNSRKHPESGMR